MLLGVDWYPEQWPRKRWETDVRLMAQMGVNVVRLAEFGWSVIEPREGEWNPTLFDEAIQLLDQYGIQVVLGTPTATPPAWLVQKHPEILLIDESGHPVSFGGRRHYSVHSPVYHDYTRKVVTQLAQHYGQDRRVIGWQIDNEFGHESSDLCYSEESRRRFHQWLQERYQSLDALNEAWGTVFWSQTYTDWAQIPVPLKPIAQHNPALLLDFRRFHADAWRRYQRLQIDVLRQHIDSEQFITHNFVWHDQAIDQQAMAQDLDFISYDNYPVWGGLKEPIPPHAIAHFLDLCRSAKGGRGFWVMEQLSGAQGWDRIGYLPRPGHIQLWTYQAVARGAEAIVYFRWRAARRGTEMFCHGVLDHDGKPKRKYREIKEVFRQLSDFGEAWIASRWQAPVAAYYAVENAWAWQIQPQSDAFDYKQEFLRFYEPVHHWNVPVDMVTGSDALDRYQVVVVPVYFLTDPAFTTKLNRFVQEGGTAVLTYRSGVKGMDNEVTERTLPGELAEMAGVEIDEYECLQRGQAHRVRGIAGKVLGMESDAVIWCDILRPTTSEVLAVYEDCFYRGEAAVTRNQHGKGRVYTIGAGLESEWLRVLYRTILEEAGVSVFPTPDGVEWIPRYGGDGAEVAALLNHLENPCGVELPPGVWIRLADEKRISGAVTIEGLGSWVLKKEGDTSDG
jgi:beta-galactosidase